MAGTIPTPLNLAKTPTPIEPLLRTSERLGANIYVKRDDLTGGVTSGNKVRKLEYSLAEAQNRGADIILSCGATQTNHGRALAALCAELGIDCHLFLLGDARDESVGNHFLIRVLGAEITYMDLSGYLDRKKTMAAAAEELIREGRTPFLIPTGASDGLGSLGYVMAAQEINQQEETMGISFDHVIVAVGSGGTVTGLFAGHELFQSNWQLHGVTVCDDADYFRSEALVILDELQRDYYPKLKAQAKDIHFVDGHKGPGYAKSNSKLRHQLIALARETGLVLDIAYTMKAWQGMERLVEDGVILPDENVLFIHTGGTSGLLGHGSQFDAADFASL